MTRLVLMCGMPGAGRTTRARLLAATPPAVRMCLDESMAGLGRRPASPSRRGGGGSRAANAAPERRHVPLTRADLERYELFFRADDHERALFDPPLV